MASGFFWLGLVCWMSVCGSLHAQEWARFRGPNGQGVSDAKGVPTAFTDADYNWKVEVPGSGYSHPVLWGKNVFVTSGSEDGTSRHVICLDADTGKILWNTSFAATPYQVHKKNNFACATPALTEDELFVAFASSEGVFMVCLTHKGKEVWRKDLGPYYSRHGFGPSPMISGEHVVLQSEQATEGAGPEAESVVIALRRSDGEPVWRTKLTSGPKAAYSTPCLTHIDGKDVLLSTGLMHGLYGLDAATGKMVWEAKVLNKRAVTSPVLAGDLMIGSSGSGGGGNRLCGVRVGGSGDVTTSHLAYTLDRSAPYVPTPVFHKGRLYTISDKGGLAMCLDAATGKALWKERVGGDFSASPIVVGDHVYLLSEAGELSVIKAADSYTLVGTSSLGDRSFCTPAVAGGRLYFRTWKYVISVGK